MTPSPARFVLVDGLTFQVLPGGVLHPVDSRAAQGRVVALGGNSVDFERLIREVVA